VKRWGKRRHFLINSYLVGNLKRESHLHIEGEKEDCRGEGTEEKGRSNQVDQPEKAYKSSQPLFQKKEGRKPGEKMYNNGRGHVSTFSTRELPKLISLIEKKEKRPQPKKRKVNDDTSGLAVGNLLHYRGEKETKMGTTEEGKKERLLSSCSREGKKKNRGKKKTGEMTSLREK